ncbi:MAG: trypsin-like peptidase domain-containing protein [Firmicutes bacterium]|nr:trypsin-like peptidase domain-containing protein [Bacillota bacterium]
MNKLYDDYEREERLNAIYGNRSAAHRQTSKGKKLLIVLAIMALAALVSIASCAAYMAAIGYAPGKSQPYTVNQVSAEAPATSVSNANAEELTTPQVIQNVLPSVVGVNVETMMGAGSGSGIIFSSDGYIVTNQHVIDGAMGIKVKLSDATEYDATIVGQDARTDLAVIKINAKDLPAATIGDSDQLVQGEGVLVIGNPLGETLSGSSTQGIISALGREIEIEGKIMHYIQTDAAINPGNSGGALVNQAGQVVGVTSAKISETSAEGLGFAIPINEAIPVIEDLINNGYVTGRPMIGISGENVSQQVSMIYGLPVGIYVRYVDPQSGAAAGGIQQGDVITALNGKEVQTLAELNNVRDEYKAGDTVTLTVFRNGQEVKVDVVLSEATASN